MSSPDDFKCRACDGTGMDEPDCSLCTGKGWVDDPRGGTMTCPNCDGDKCSRCNGSGEEPE